MVYILQIKIKYYHNNFKYILKFRKWNQFLIKIFIFEVDEQKIFLLYSFWSYIFNIRLVQDYIRPNYEGGNDLIIYFLE